MIGFFSAGCGRRNSARRALPGESVGRKGIGYPIGGFPTPKAFPSGGRCPSAHTGADEGAIPYPTFPCRKGTIYRLSPQRHFSFAPLGNPVAPSSVTSGDSFPPRGSLRRCYTPATKCSLTQPLLPQNANPNQGTYMGYEIAPPPEQCGTTAKTSEWERAGHKKGGAGGIPPRLFASGLSLEKAWIPARDRAGRTTPQVPTCAGPNLDHLPTAKPPPLSKLALSRLECQGLQFGHNIQKTSSQNGGILLVQRLTGASWEPPGKRQPSCCVPHIL